MGDHFKLIDGQTYLGKTVYNVTHWEIVSGAGSAADLAGAWPGWLYADLLQVQSDQLTHDQISVENLDNLADYATVPLTTGNVGLNAGDELPAFMAWAFRLNRSERGHHHGHIRFAGLTETLITNHVADSAALALLNNIAATLSADIIGASGAHYHIRIHRAANSIKPGYSNAEAFYNPSSVQYVGISTQNSRK